MAKSDKFIEDYVPVSTRGYSDSQSPQAHRGGTQDPSSDKVQMSDNPNQRVTPENAGAGTT